MGLDQIDAALRRRYTFEEREHATSILAADFPQEFREIQEVLHAFTLQRSHIVAPGGGRSLISRTIDSLFVDRGWRETSFDTKFLVDGREIPTPTHKIDNFKNCVGVEVEWNNKTEFYDRDLNNFRLLRQLKVLSVGVIITRLSELQNLFDELGRGASFGNSTTHWDKLIPKVEGGGAGGCPVLLIGLGMACYDPTR